MPKILNEQTQTYQARLPQKIIEEIEKQEGSTNGEKLINYLKKKQNTITLDTNPKILETKIKQLTEEIEQQTEKILQTYNELNIIQTHQQTIQEHQNKINKIPNINKLKTLWKTHITPAYNILTNKSLKQKWEQILQQEKQPNNPEETYQLLKEDNQLYPNP